MADGNVPTGLRTDIVFRDVSITLAEMQQLYLQLQKLGASPPLQQSLEIMMRLDRTLDGRIIHVTSRSNSLRYRVEEYHNLPPGEHTGMAGLGSKMYSSAEVDAI